MEQQNWKTNKNLVKRKAKKTQALSDLYFH